MNSIYHWTGFVLVWGVLGALGTAFILALLVLGQRQFKLLCRLGLHSKKHGYAYWTNNDASKGRCDCWCCDWCPAIKCGVVRGVERQEGTRWNIRTFNGIPRDQWDEPYERLDLMTPEPFP